MKMWSEITSRKVFFRSLKKYVILVTSCQNKGVFPDPEKLEAVERFLVPTAVKLVREFLGFARYYWRFVPRFTQIAGLLYQLLHANICPVPVDRQVSCCI